MISFFILSKIFDYLLVIAIFYSLVPFIEWFVDTIGFFVLNLITNIIKIIIYLVKISIRAIIYYLMSLLYIFTFALLFDITLNFFGYGKNNIIKFNNDFYEPSFYEPNYLTNEKYSNYKNYLNEQNNLNNMNKQNIFDIYEVINYDTSNKNELSYMIINKNDTYSNNI